MFNILIDPLPTKLIHKNKIIPFKTDFRVWLKLLSVINDGDQDVIYKHLIYLFFDKIAICEDINLKLLNFLSCAKNINDISNINNNDNTRVKNCVKPLYDLLQDNDAVFNSFFYYYKLDLTSLDYLHWYKFRILLNGLDNTTSLGKRIEIRSIDINSIKDKKTKAEIIKAKKELEIKTKNEKQKTRAEKQIEFNKSFSRLFK